MAKLTRSLAAVIGILCMTSAWASNCDVGFKVIFFNGVGNTVEDAESSKFATRAAIRDALGTVFDAYDSQPVLYDIAYNTTQGTLNDVAETFAMRAQQIDPSGVLANNFFYLYWSYLGGGPSQGYANQIISSTPSSLTVLTNALLTLPQAVTGLLSQDLGTLVNAAPTYADLGMQQATMNADIAGGYLQLLVAHSQGNLFVDLANNYLSGTAAIPIAQYATVHVAPATARLFGPWMLSTNDFVINGLGLISGNIPSSNLALPVTTADPAGHGYSEIYLNESLYDHNTGLAARTIAQNHFTQQLAYLDNQQCQLQVSPPSTTVNPGDSVPLSATLTPALAPNLDTNHITVKYKWSVSGTIGGTFTDPLTGALAPTVVTTQPNVKYHAFNAYSSGQSGTDQIGVELDVSTFDNGATTSKVLAKGGVATISTENPWVGSWVGSTVSSCGSYSGPQDFTITQIGPDTLSFGPYDATFSGNTATVGGGIVVFTLSGNTISGYEADSCQRGTYTRVVQ